MLPVVMASILGVYGLITSVIIVKKMDLNNANYNDSYKSLAAGLCCGLTSIASGYVIG